MTHKTTIHKKFNWFKRRNEYFWLTKCLQNGKTTGRSTESYFNKSELLENMSNVANSLIKAIQDERNR